MEFSVTIKKGNITVKIFGPQPDQVQSFFSIIDKINANIEELYKRKPSDIVFDLTDIKFIDSYLISSLVRAHQLSTMSKHAIITSDDTILAIVELVGLNQLYSIYKTKKDFNDHFCN